MSTEATVNSVTETTAMIDARRNAITAFIRGTGWSFVLKATAQNRWGQDVTVRIAEKGTFKDIPVKGWTNTATGTIFMREEIFDGIDFTNHTYRRAVEIVVSALAHGNPINRTTLHPVLVYADEDTRETVWRIAQTIVAAYGVFGHEYGHAAYSEHAGRDPWHMGLEDLRCESLWMAQDPIRARQGLRACASFWVTHDTSPMAGARTLDLSKIKTHASLLSLYLLLGGRGRIGVLDDQSSLVVGLRDLAESVLGWETISEANDIIDRFIETSEDIADESGAARRRALAEEFARLLPKSAGKPEPGGCVCGPQSEDEGEGQTGEGEGEGEAEDSDGESDEGKDGKGKAGEDEGDEASTDEGDGNASDADDGSDAGDVGSDSSGGEGEGEGDEDDEEGDGDEGDEEGDGDEDEDEGEDGLTIGTNRGGGDGGDDSGGEESEESPDFITGTYGEQIRPGEEEITDELDDSDAYQLTPDQIEALAEVLSEGLEEIGEEGEAGWSLSEEEGVILKSQSEAPARVAKDVFSKQALTTRNRRLRAGRY